MVASGELSAPVVIGRDHLDAGSVASPYRETESMADGSDAIADWPLLNALVNTASGATWVSIHHGGGVGIGRSIHAGQVTVADGTRWPRQKLERVLTNDPAMGVLRHVDAGYPEADVAGSRREPGLTRIRWRGADRVPPDAGHEHRRTPTASRFAAAWAELAGIGRDHRRGGYSRHVFDDADMQLRDWFTEQAERRGLHVESDRNANLWAWWGEPGARRGGHRFASGLGARRWRVRRPARSGVRAAGHRRTARPRLQPARPLAVVCFAEEEGGRFGLPCLGRGC